MQARTTRRACQARLDQLRGQGLVVPSPFNAELLCRRISTCLQQKITLIAMPMPTGVPYGLTLFTDEGHYIAYEERTTRVHQDLIISHELGHILFGHRAVALEDDESSLLLMPTLRPSLVRRLMGRRTGVYSAIEEHEAETMGTLLVELANRDEHDPEVALEAGQAEVYQRLRTSLEHPER